MSKRHFEDFMTTGQTKTASAPVIKTDLLAKIASAIGEPNLADNAAAAAAVANSGMATGVPGMPVMGQIVNAGAQSVGSPAPGVVEATDGLINPQIAAAGGNPAAQAVGSNPGVGTVSPVRVSDGTVEGGIEENMAIVNSVTNGSPVSAEKTASLVDACDMGRAMARSYSDELQKIAFFQQYEEAASLLKQAGLLQGYDVAGMDKTASADEFYALDKLASGADLSFNDVICAANEYLTVKEAEARIDAEAEKIANEIMQAAADEVADEITGTGNVADAAADAAAAAVNLTTGRSSNDVVNAAHAAASAAGAHGEDKIASAPGMSIETARQILALAGR